MPTPHKTFEKVLSKDEILTRLYFVIPYDLPHSTKKIEVIFARYFSIANGRIDYAYDMGFEAGKKAGMTVMPMQIMQSKSIPPLSKKKWEQYLINKHQAGIQSIFEWLKSYKEDNIVKQGIKNYFIADLIRQFECKYLSPKDAITKSVEDLAAMRWNVQQSDNKARERLFKSKPKDAKVDKICHAELCPHCNELIALRNPSGFCDHLYYPENCEVCKKHDADAKM
jgi:hypothetical protein